MNSLGNVPAGAASVAPPALYSQSLGPVYGGEQFLDLDNGPEESLLRHYLRLFYKHRWLILGAVVACLGLAVLVSVLTQRQYTASVRVQIAREAAKVVNVEGVEGEQGEGRDLEFYQTQYALLKSRTLAEAVVRDLRLADNYVFLSQFKAGDVDALRALPRDERFERATKIVQRQTEVKPLPGSSVVDLAYTTPDPAVAAKIANSLANNFIRTNLSRRYDATAYAREFLQNRIDATRAKLEESERRSAQYAQEQGIIKVAGDGEGRISSEQTLASSDLTQLSAQLSAARGARVQAEAEYRANSGGSAAANSLTNSAVNDLRAQRAQLSGELSKLLSDFGPEYPKVAALRSQVTELDRQISREQGRVTSSVSQNLADRYRQALATENGLQSRVNGLKSAVLNQQQRSIRFNIIQRDVDTNRALYDALLQRFKEVGVAGGVGTNNVSIVDPALPPENPSKPNLPLNMALGLLAGLMLGGGAAFAREQLADSVILPSEFQRKLGVKLLGSTPQVNLKTSDNELAKSQQRDLSEAYFSILTAIQFSSSDRAPASMLFTSTQPNEGKSTSALAIARALALVGANVLLIDGDMRNPSLQRLVGRPMTVGLGDILAGRATLAETVHPGGAQGLSLMFAGRLQSDPAQLLGTVMLDRLVSEAAKDFDHIIIDGPPILGIADSVLISRVTAGTVFVVEAGNTRASQARLALDRLRIVRSNVIGAILTKLNAKEQGYGGDYGYAYGYGKNAPPRKLLDYLAR